MLYGTCYAGGANGLGTIYKVDTSTDTVTKLYDFADTSPHYGKNPEAGLLYISGILYGATKLGGVNGAASNKGTIFKYDIAGAAHTTLYSFDGTHGEQPLARLIQAQDGKLYGTANLGGANSFGVVFSGDISGATQAVVKDYAGSSNGKFPYAALVQTQDVTLYAFAYQGGSQDKGTAVSLTGSGFSTLTLLHEFADLSFFGGADNALQLVHAFDANGNRVQVDTWWGPLGYGYDALNRPTSLSDPGFSAAGKASGNTGWTYDSTPSGEFTKNLGNLQQHFPIRLV